MNYKIKAKLASSLLNGAHIRQIILIAIFAAIAGCVVDQPESIKTVAAFEVPLLSEADRDQFLSVLHDAAELDGMHVDAASKSDLEMLSKVSENTLNAAVCRGANDDEVIAFAMDMDGHLGQVWILFSRGENPTVATKFQKRVMREIMRHWPNTLALPIMPTGAIPLHDDLIRTPAGYLVKPSEAHKYGLTITELQPH